MSKTKKEILDNSAFGLETEIVYFDNSVFSLAPCSGLALIAVAQPISYALSR